MSAERTHNFFRRQNLCYDLFGLNRMMTVGGGVLIVLAVVLAVYGFFHLAPPKTIIMTSGPEGSIYQRHAEKYRQILARNGITLKILPSQGSLENLKRLNDPAVHVDIGFVQGGMAKEMKVDGLVSLGSLYSSPLLVFYRNNSPLEFLSQFSGKRLALGPVESGSHSLALALLAANDIQPGGPAQLTDIGGDNAAQALLDGRCDAVFLMGESAPSQTMRLLLRSPGIRIYNFTQADAYVRRLVYLNKLELPEGAVDFGKNIPDHAVSLVGPTIELVAREGLHPALSDLLLETAREVHGDAGLYRKQGEFPAPLEHEFRLSPDALRFYKSGKGFLYRFLPFWMASVANRALAVFLPMVVILISVTRNLPAIYRWKIRQGIYRWYRELLALERDMLVPVTAERQRDLLDRLDQVENAVNRMSVPVAFADQFYVLRGHISFVRDRLKT